MITDNRADSVLPANPVYLANGGRVTINSYNVNLQSGSSINVSGGVTVGATGAISYGTGGSITIAAGQDLEIPTVLGGRLTLGANLAGYSGGTGGSLNILAPLIQVGGASSNPNSLLLSPDFFSQGGFSSFSLIGLGEATGQPEQFVPGVVIAPGTLIAPVAQSWQASLDPNGPGTLALTPALLPQGLRTPVSLSFRAPDIRDPFNGTVLPAVRGDFVMGEGAVIQTDPRASVSISGDTAAVLGSIFAPGGRISISGGNSVSLFSAGQSEALPTVDIGPDSILSAAGTTLLTPNSLGLRTGTVLAGGNITISGNIVAENGSVMDVSGASDVLDLAPGYSGTALSGSLAANSFVPTRVDSNGGSITLERNSGTVHRCRL